MRPAYVVLHMEQGATFNDTLTLTDDAGAPIDLTGRSARMQVRRSTYEGGALILELSTANGRIGALGPSGVITFHIPADVLAAVPLEFDYDSFVFDLELTYMDGLEEIVERPVRGTVVFWREVTV